MRRGKIVGCLSLKTEATPFKFEFNPIQTGNFSEVVLENELGRLSLEVEMDSEGR